MKLAWWQRRNPDAPWLTPDAVGILESWLKPSDRGIEWGAGRSTIWLGKRVQSLLSVEPDAAWFAEVRGKINSHVVSLWHCKDSPEYVAFANRCEDESLDFALVDGKRRDECMLAAIPKLKPGGVIILDNANWFWPNRRSASPPSPTEQKGRWSEVWSAVESWRVVWTTCGVTDTAFFFKPPS